MVHTTTDIHSKLRALISVTPISMRISMRISVQLRLLYFPTQNTPPTCAPLLSAFLLWLTLSRLQLCLHLFYPYFSVSCAASLTTFPSWFLLHHMPLCMLLSYPDYSSHMCIFAYCFYTLIISHLCAALLKTFLPLLFISCDLSPLPISPSLYAAYLLLSCRDCSSIVFSFAYNFFYPDYSYIAVMSKFPK